MRVKITLFLLLFLGLLLGGCGYNSAGTAPSATATSPSATSTAVRPTPGSMSATPPTVVPAQGTPGPGQVTVQTSASLYRPGDTIMVTIANHAAQTIFFANHQTNCTVVTLQIQNGSIWQSINPCKLMIHTITETLGAGGSVSVSLKAVHAWAAGTYRILFRYGNKAVNSVESLQNAFSPLFRVN